MTFERAEDAQRVLQDSRVMVVDGRVVLIGEAKPKPATAPPGGGARGSAPFPRRGAEPPSLWGAGAEPRGGGGGGRFPQPAGLPPQGRVPVPPHFAPQGGSPPGVAPVPLQRGDPRAARRADGGGFGGYEAPGGFGWGVGEGSSAVSRVSPDPASAMAPSWAPGGPAPATAAGGGPAGGGGPIVQFQAPLPHHTQARTYHAMQQAMHHGGGGVRPLGGAVAPATAASQAAYAEQLLAQQRWGAARGGGAAGGPEGPPMGGRAPPPPPAAAGPCRMCGGAACRECLGTGQEAMRLTALAASARYGASYSGGPPSMAQMPRYMGAGGDAIGGEAEAYFAGGGDGPAYLGGGDYGGGRGDLRLAPAAVPAHAGAEFPAAAWSGDGGFPLPLPYYQQQPLGALDADTAAAAAGGSVHFPQQMGWPGLHAAAAAASSPAGAPGRQLAPGGGPSRLGGSEAPAMSFPGGVTGAGAAAAVAEDPLAQEMQGMRIGDGAEGAPSGHAALDSVGLP